MLLRVWEGTLAAGDKNFAIIIPGTGHKNRPLLVPVNKLFKETFHINILYLYVRFGI